MSGTRSTRKKVGSFGVPASDYAGSWVCPWVDPGLGLVQEPDLDLLQHVNCEYLSSGKPPTLLALKQHAQSLTNLIKRIALSGSFGIVDGTAEKRDPEFCKDDAFDWLSDLDKPYTNNDESHHIPLWSLANQVKWETELTGPEFHCPLEEVSNWPSVDPGEGPIRPYRTHHNLVMHVNDCLEILDHEYSATGGILSLLPSEEPEDGEQMRAAKETIFGQWLLHHQKLIGRMHELEINYANALDLIAGEAVVPMQMLAQAGASGRSQGRELAYPQDRFVLANCGDDVFDLLHRLMDKDEGLIEQREKIWKNAGVAGERMWDTKRGGEWYARGMVPVDMVTRFYRIKGQGKSTIFVLPAIEQHPTVAHTRKIEGRPTVVSVVTPKWPERVTDIESKQKHDHDTAVELKNEVNALMLEVTTLRDRLSVASGELRKRARQIKNYEEAAEMDEDM